MNSQLLHYLAEKYLQRRIAQRKKRNTHFRTSYCKKTQRNWGTCFGNAHKLDEEKFRSQKKLQIDGTHPSLCFEGGLTLEGCQGVSDLIKT